MLLNYNKTNKQTIYFSASPAHSRLFQHSKLTSNKKQLCISHLSESLCHDNSTS